MMSPNQLKRLNKWIEFTEDMCFNDAIEYIKLLFGNDVSSIFRGRKLISAPNDTTLLRLFPVKSMEAPYWIYHNRTINDRILLDVRKIPLLDYVSNSKITDEFNLPVDIRRGACDITHKTTDCLTIEADTDILYISMDFLMVLFAKYKMRGV